MKTLTSIKKKFAVLYFAGTNCEIETLEAIKLAGANGYLMFAQDIVSGKIKITDCDLLWIPGGFSYGDHVDCGIVAATLIRDFIPELLESKILVLGICNGFQILMRAEVFGKNITLAKNDSGVFCSKPVSHKVTTVDCIWTKGLEGELLFFPSAHGYGKIVWTMTQPPKVVMTYVLESPNGGSVAAICTGENSQILGIMDHPERPYGNRDGQKIIKRGLLAV